MQKFIINKNDEGQRLDRFLRKNFPDLALSQIYKLLRKKEVKINNKSAKKENILEIGDEIKIYLKKEENISSKNQKSTPDFQKIYNSKYFKDNFEIVFEDEFLMIINKPAGMPVHPGSGSKFGHNVIDLANAYVFNKNADTPAPKLAHRLDQDTSGLLIISKNDGTLRKISALLRENGVKKIYQTIVKGKLKNKIGIIDDKILRDDKGIKISEKREAKTALTKYRVIKEFKEASLVEVEIKTGRTHQIRVHFAGIGHPVLMDEKHGDFAWNKEMSKKTGLKRQFLHAEKLSFIHPETEKQVEIKAKLTEDLQSALSCFQ